MPPEMLSRTRSCRSKEGTFDKKYRCMHPGCFKRFTRKEHLQRHKLNHEQLPGWPCSRCDRSFYRFDLLQRHCLAHHGVKPAKLPQRHDDTTQAPSDSPMLKNSMAIGSTWLSPGTPQENDKLIGGIDGMLSSPASSHTPQGGIGETLTARLPELSIAHEFRGDKDLARVDNIIHSRYMSSISYEGLEWLFDDDSMAQYGIFDLQSSVPLTAERITASDDLSSFEALPLCPLISESEVEIDLEKMVSHQPECNFKVCHALTEEHRTQLLWSLHSDLPDLDIENPLLSLDSLKNGLHLYFKFLSPEYSIFHRCLITQMSTHKRQIQTSYGESPPWQLLWAMIIFGWSVPSFQDASDARKVCEMSQQIHKTLRNYILTVSATFAKQITLTPTPSLSLTQLLFLVLVYARYHSPEDSCGFAITLHGVLVENVRKFECHDTVIPDSWKLDDPISGEEEWFKWMKRESLKRVIFQTFILDVQQTILHGSDMRMSPFELDYSLPSGDNLWFAESVDEWREIYLQEKQEEDSRGSYHYLTLLKKFWNNAPAIFSTIRAQTSQSSTRMNSVYNIPGQNHPYDKTPAFAFSRGSRIIMYGVLAIAWDIRQRSDTNFFHFVQRNQSYREKILSKGGWTSTELSSHIEKSAEDWVSWWTSEILTLSLKHIPYTWRNCPCMFRLAPILYEVGPLNLQIISGREIIEGRKVRASEYLSCRRKIKQWVGQESALSGIAGAAKIIQDRLSPSFSPSTHCHHCSWILYLAGIVCWVYGFALQNGWPTSLVNPPTREQHEGASTLPHTLHSHPDLVREACDAYLQVTVKASNQTSGNGVASETLARNLRQSKCVLLILADILEKENSIRGSWLTNEAIESIKALGSR